MLKYLKKKLMDDSLLGLHRNDSESFSRVHKDITHIRTWIYHLHDKKSRIEASHNEHVTRTRSDIKNLNKWLEYFSELPDNYHMCGPIANYRHMTISEAVQDAFYTSDNIQ